MKEIKDSNIVIKISARDREELSNIARERGLDLSKLITYSIEPFLLKRKIDAVINTVEGNNAKDITKLMASKSLLEYYVTKLDEMKRELQSKIDNIVLGRIILDSQKEQSPVINKRASGTKKRNIKRELSKA